jgi:broad specificity phosphatase PhoE
MRVISVLAALLACAPVGSAPTVESEPRTATETSSAPEQVAPRTLVFVRHGEKQNDARDAPLSDAGRVRAQCLAASLALAGVSHVFHSEYERTRDTAAPTAAQSGVTPQVLPAANRAELVAALRALPAAATALVVGHSNSIPDLLRELGVGEVAIGEQDFDRMFVVLLPADGPARLLRLRYCITP